ncbi:MAG: prolipoprotein diacylglyceryl transferase [Clostridiales bacterium]|nr:prolipoprotein diacylglyceryl transferase [Clostridiales bacterium]
MHPIFYVFGLELPAYGLSLIFGALAAYGLGVFLARKKGDALVRENFSYIFLIAIGAALAGAFLFRPLTKIVEVAIHWNAAKHWTAEALVYYLFGEMVFYGGVIGGFLGILFFCRKFHIPLLPMLDVAAAPLALGHALGRIGCLMGGCCYGQEVCAAHPFAIVYPEVSLGAPPNVPLLAVPLLEAVFLVILAIALALLFVRARQRGLTVAVYLLAYSVWRFVLEFFRGDAVRGVYAGLSTSQYVSLALFLFGIGVILYIVRKNRGGQENVL